MLDSIIQSVDGAEVEPQFVPIVESHRILLSAIVAEKPHHHPGGNTSLPTFASSILSMTASFDDMCRSMSSINSRLLQMGSRLDRIATRISHPHLASLSHKAAVVARQLNSIMDTRRHSLASSQRVVDFFVRGPLDATLKLNTRTSEIMRAISVSTHHDHFKRIHAWLERCKQGTSDDATATRNLAVFASSKETPLDVTRLPPQITLDSADSLRLKPQGRLLLRMWDSLATFNAEVDALTLPSP